MDDVYSGKITAETIDQNYYNNLANNLTKAVFKGLTGNNPVDGDSFEATDYRNTLKAYLDQNIYAFSGAKSLTVAKQYNALLVDDDGHVRSKADFKKAVLSVDKLYNKTYLDAEHDTAIASAQMAESWQGLQKYSLLQFRTSGGENVCPICGGFDNMRIATDDPALNKMCPPLHFKCHCNLIPAAGNAVATNKADLNNQIKAANIQPYFRNNPGKTKIIYNDKHPYFKSLPSGKESELDAEKNYAMPSGEKIYKTADLPGFKPLANKGAAYDWWEAKAGSTRGDVVFKSKDNLSITFKNGFKNHVLEQNKDNRFRIIHLTEDVVKNPDEVWSNRVKGRLDQVYIKYYDTYPVVVVINVETDVEGVTMYEVQKGGKVNFDALNNMRKGVLKYKK